VKVWACLKDTNYDSFKIVGTPLKTRIDGMADADHYMETTKSLALVGIEVTTHDHHASLPSSSS
jgi:hypothetical protein